MRYDITTDAFIPVTQEWVDEVQQKFNKLGFMIENARALQISIENFLATWESGK